MKIAAALTLSALVVTSGCAAFESDSGSTSGGGGDQPAVAAAFYPLYYAAERVAGEHADVQNLTQPGGEPHDLELTVRQSAELADADLVVHESGFQPAIDEGIEQNAGGAVLDAVDVADLIAAEESPDEHEEHADEDGAHADEHADEGDDHADEPADEGDDHGHDHGDEDPHFWHDPLRMADLGDAIADELAELDPDHGEDFAANAADLRSDLEQLDADFAEGLADCQRDIIVVSHDAFGYLEKYDLHLASIAGLSPDAEPTPAHLAELQRLIRSEGLTTVFSERLGADLSRSLAADLDLETAVLDPVEGLTDETSEEDYLSLMRQNLEAISTANECRT